MEEIFRRVLNERENQEKLVFVRLFPILRGSLKWPPASILGQMKTKGYKKRVKDTILTK